MSKQKIPCIRDKVAEQHSQIEIEVCTGYLCDDGTVRVFGEAVAQNNNTIDEAREVHVILYDPVGDIVGRNEKFWRKFGVRQSFRLGFRGIDGDIAKIKIYPTNW